jgi:steroid delta-isomerase-like uncharacterized protein
MSNGVNLTSRRIWIILALAMVILYFISRLPRKKKTLKDIQRVEQNRSNSHRFFEEIWNQGNTTIIDELLAPDYVRRDLLTPVHGREEFKQFVSLYRAAFPDMYITIESQIAEGDMVVDRWVGGGTHSGEFLGIPPTGRQVRITGIGINRFDNGKLVETWTNNDALGMLQQLGVIPPLARNK